MSSYAILAVALALVACADDKPKATTAAPAEREPPTAKVSRASRDAFVACAKRHEELGQVVERGDAARVSAPRAIATLLARGGQFVGLRDGEGPDLDVLFVTEPQGADSGDTVALIEEEAGAGSFLGSSGGTTAQGRFQFFMTLAVGDDPPKRLTKPVQDALNACLTAAAEAAE